MSKIAVFLPKENMYENAKRIIADKGMDISILKVIKTENAIEEARMAIESGISIIVARGVQAQIIKESMNVSVVEIKLSAQELAVLVTEAKKMTKKKKPHIAVIASSNMLSNMDYFEEIFDINLSVYNTLDNENAPKLTKQAICDGADIIIGNNGVCSESKRNEVKSLFLEAKEDSIRDAITTAKKMSYAADMERNAASQLEVVMDMSYSGIIKVDSKRNITLINHMALMLINKEQFNVISKPIEEIIPQFDIEPLLAVLEGRRDIYTASLDILRQPTLITIAPLYDEITISGAIISIYKLLANRIEDSEKYKEVLMGNNFSRINFSDMKTKSLVYSKCLEKGKMYSLSPNPVLIYGDIGTDKENYAKCLHNGSSAKGGPFIKVDIRELSKEMQLKVLFGDYNDEGEKTIGAFENAKGGSLFLLHIEDLSIVCQAKLYRAIEYGEICIETGRIKQVYGVRVIVTSDLNLLMLVQEGKFLNELYYSLSGLVVSIPSLSERKEDLPDMIEAYCKCFCNKYSKYITITDEAINIIANYNWSGGEIQFKAFLERLLLTTVKKSIGEDYVQILLRELYPAIELKDNEKRLIIYKHPNALRIIELLKKYDGKRGKVAEEMGISTATLWRHMKKYGISEKYESL